MNSVRRSPLQLVVLAVVALGAIAVAGGLAYLFLRPAAPAPVALGSPSPGSSSVAAMASSGARRSRPSSSRRRPSS